MSTTKLDQMTPEQLRNLPPDYPCMVFLPGRYYLCIFYVYLPQCEAFPNGGNISGQVFRIEADPTCWHQVWRFRYYCDRSGDPDAPDRRTWYYAKLPRMAEAKALAKTKKLVELWAMTADVVLGAGKADVFEIKGDHEHWQALATSGKGPEWLRVQQMFPA